MKRRWVNLISMAAMAPLAMTVHPDSSVTSFSVALGGGSYADVTRGCDNSVLSADKRHFEETGLAVKHEFRGPFEVGVRATILNDMPEYQKGTWLLNPHVAVEGRHVGFGIGYVHVPSDEPYHYERDYEIVPASGHLRIGGRGGYFSLHLNEDLPITSGGGSFRMGVGFRAGKPADVWLGTGAVPYDQLGFITRVDIHPARAIDLHLAARLGSSEKISENAVSAGVTLRLSHGRRDGRE